MLDFAVSCLVFMTFDTVEKERFSACIFSCSRCISALLLGRS